MKVTDPKQFKLPETEPNLSGDPRAAQSKTREEHAARDIRCGTCSHFAKRHDGSDACGAPVPFWALGAYLLNIAAGRYGSQTKLSADDGKDCHAWHPIAPDTSEPPKPSSGNAFYDHLDACRRCREEPFNLCAVGEKLLKSAALGAIGDEP